MVGLPLIKLGALASRQASKPVVKALINEAKGHPQINTVCIYFGRLQVGTANMLFRLSTGESLKQAAAAAVRTEGHAGGRGGGVATTSRNLLGDVAAPAPPHAADLRRASLGHYRDAPLCAGGEVGRGRRRSDRAVVEPWEIDAPPTPIPAHDHHHRRPDGSGDEAPDKEGDVRPAERRLRDLGNRLGRPIVTRVRRGLATQQQRFFVPVAPETLRDAGAELIVELIAFVIAALILWWELDRQARAAREKEELQERRLLELERKVNELAAKDPSIGSLAVGGGARQRLSWWLPAFLQRRPRAAAKSSGDETAAQASAAAVSAGRAPPPPPPPASSGPTAVATTTHA